MRTISLTKNLTITLVSSDCFQGVEVEAMPTFLFLKEGKLVKKLVGARKEELQDIIVKLAAIDAA